MQVLQDWLNAPQILNTACEPYGYGEGAVGKARSITVEDVNKITGYDPTNEDGNGTPFRAGTIDEYGNKVTYRYNGTTNPAYEGTNGVSGTLSYAHSKGFRYYDGKEFKYINNLTTGTNGTAFAELTVNYYGYAASNYINSTENTKVYQMLFGTSGSYSKYWLASSCVQTGKNYAFFCIRYVGNGYVVGDSLWRSDTLTYYNELGARAVVTLSSDIEFTGSSAEGWSYNN